MEKRPHWCATRDVFIVSLAPIEDATDKRGAGGTQRKARPAAERAADLMRAVADRARRQHGTIAAWQLLEIGVSRRWIRRRVEIGVLHRIHRGVYAVGHTRLTRRGRLMAAVLAGGRGATLAMISAAELWGLVDYRRTTIHVIVHRQRRSRPGLKFHSSTLPSDERRVRDGIPVTSVPRTLFDLSVTLDRHRLARALERAESRELTDEYSLHDLLLRYPRRPGSPKVRAVLGVDHAFARTRSGFEEEFLSWLERSGLPRPVVNTTLSTVEGRPEVDCCWPDAGLVVELDDYSSHGGRRSFAEDRRRDRRLRVAGLTPIRVVPADIAPGEQELRSQLAQLLRS